MKNVVFETLHLRQTAWIFVILTLLVVIAFQYIVISSSSLTAYHLMLVPGLVFLVGLILFSPDILLWFLFMFAPLLWVFGYINLISTSGFKLNLPILIGGMVSVGLYPYLLHKDSDHRVEQVRRTVILFSVITIPPTFYAKDMVTGIGAYLRVISPLIVMFVTMRFAIRKNLVKRYLKAMLLSISGMAVVIVVQFLRGSPLVSFGGFTRIAAMYISPQQLSYYFTVMIAIVMLHYGLTRKPIYFLLLFSLLVGIYFTFVRTAWLGVTLMLSVMPFLLKRAYALRLLIVLAIIVGLFNLTKVIDTFMRYSSEVHSIQSLDAIATGRISVDVINLNYYFASSVLNKLFGIGLYQSLQVTQSSYIGRPLGIHNDYLSMMIEAGVLSLVVYLALLFLLIRQSYMAMKNAKGTLAHAVFSTSFVLMITFIIMGILGAWYTNVLSGWYVFGLMGLMLAQIKLQQGVHDESTNS